uniref:L-lactate dehydrogenase n=1 Tax=Siphoviridae sp. ctwuP1 TaxID=2827972 RepID=A0A8S5TB53_9CAUD|nr:MAG TPA: L-lactate dehydrogenase [Siphoviridae sp. ctwuP1]
MTLRILGRISGRNALRMTSTSPRGLSRNWSN